ncbi:MAG: hypothetical protein PHG85_03370 [Candidatus Altiarchaeota archaeon]|nr:hypothetical protein [Candidatus Altiarchaeota archaeon]
MATLLCATWLPRSHIHLFKMHGSLDNVSLNLSDVEFGDDLCFCINGYSSYKKISFRQEWGGLISFTVDVPDDGAPGSAVQFMRDMQELLMNEILKKCFLITFMEISNDILPLDFHVVVISGRKPDAAGDLLEKKAGSVSISYSPEEVYSPGTVSYASGAVGPKVMEVLLWHAYTEVASSFMMNMLKRMNRLYHEADDAVKEVESLEGEDALHKSIDLVDVILKDSSQSFGKLKQAQKNFSLKQQEFCRLKLGASERKVAEALEVEKSLGKLVLDADYIVVWWEDVLIDYLKNIDSTLDARMMLHTMPKKKETLW